MSENLENKLFDSVYSKLCFVMDNETALKLTYEFIDDKIKSTEKKMVKEIIGIIGYKKIKKLREKLYEKDDEKLMLFESKNITNGITKKRVSKKSKNKDSAYIEAVKAQKKHAGPRGGLKAGSSLHYERDY